jgi:Protein of unknown function (DUF2934)
MEEDTNTFFQGADHRTKSPTKTTQEHAIRLRAYEIWEASGQMHRHEVHDWLEAEKEITRKA